MLDTKQSTKKSLLKYIGVIPVIAIIFFAFSCEKKVNTTNDKTAFYESMMHPKNTYFQAYDMNGREISSDSARHFLFNDIQLEGLQNIPEEAKKAGLTNYVVNVGILIDSSGKIIKAKALQGQKLRGEWKDDLGYGINDVAEKYVMNLPKLYRQSINKAGSDEIKNPIPGYTYDFIRLQFGDRKVWKSVNETGVSITCHGSNMNYDNSFLEQHNLSELDKFINANLKYPESQIKSNISGRVIISFGVGEHQKIEDIKVISGINKDFDNEALRVMREFAKTNRKLSAKDPDKPILSPTELAEINKNSKRSLPSDTKYRFNITYPINFELK